MIAVVDAQAAQGRQQMLDRADRDAGVVAEHGAERQVLDVLDVGRDLGDDAAAFADKEAKPVSASAGCRTIETGAPLCTPVPDSSISRAIVVCRDPINRFDICARPSIPCRASHQCAPEIRAPPTIVRRPRLRGSYCVAPSHGRRFELRPLSQGLSEHRRLRIKRYAVPACGTNHGFLHCVTAGVHAAFTLSECGFL